MDICKKLAAELGITAAQVEAVIRLMDEGNTIPFIARYRKEATGSLNDEILRNLDERLRYLRNLDEKRQQAMDAVAEQGKLTDELKAQFLAAETLIAVEDLYRPYRQKRKTRASVAKEKGLEPLAQKISEQRRGFDPMKEAAAFVSPEKDVKTPEDAIQGASDILAEQVADVAEYRTFIRDAVKNCGSLTAEAKKPEVKSVYENYYHYEESIRRTAGHKILAINRGESEKILTVRIQMDEEAILRYLAKKTIRPGNPLTETILRKMLQDSWRRLIQPAVEREIRSELTEKAEEGAIRVFGKNLEQLLLQPPIAGRVVLGWDPAFRTGCKLAVVDPTGKVLDTVVIYPTAPQNKVEEAKKTLRRLIDRYNISLISLGNGTASRESEQIIVDFLKEIPQKVAYVIVNEAGASVYSASKLATEEFPQFDVGQRSAVSIARRLQDPLAELVKIEPRSIGVGQYQHDMNQKRLSEALQGVVEDCVNGVGVDLNTASASLLEYVAGISHTVAGNIVKYREANGSFTNRKQLLKVPKLGPKAYEQCAGFLRVRNGEQPLDSTAVHPESYAAAAKLLKKLGVALSDLGSPKMKKALSRVGDLKKIADEVGVGLWTLEDIMKELEKPGRDPREDMPAPVLRTDVLEMKDLKPGMILRGTVRNVIDFGAFVDIGVHQDGLVHISQICDRFIKHPLEAVKIGDVVEVMVMQVDLEKKRISLTMKGINKS